MDSRCCLSDFCSNSAYPKPLHTLQNRSTPTHHSCCLPLSTRFPASLQLVSFSSNRSSRRLECVVDSFRASHELIKDAASEEKKNHLVARKKLAVFVSGGGSNFKSIHQACLDGSVLGDVVALVTNKTDCGGAEYAKNKEIPVLQFPRTKDGAEGALSATDLVDALRILEVDFVILAGFLKLIPVELIRAYPRAILNIHPSLLPAFGGKGYYGMKVHTAVIRSGARSNNTLCGRALRHRAHPCSKGGTCTSN
ncbi:Phosphoribosylglycinamide formyltransferase, chloroplastic [Linum grandiflorum]